jgi:hypothetical protein
MKLSPASYIGTSGTRVLGSVPNEPNGLLVGGKFTCKERIEGHSYILTFLRSSRMLPDYKYRGKFTAAGCGGP